MTADNSKDTSGSAEIESKSEAWDSAVEVVSNNFCKTLTSMVVADVKTIVSGKQTIEDVRQSLAEVFRPDGNFDAMCKEALSMKRQLS